MNARAPILVTGGTGALGSAIVARLRARNYAVVANYFRDEPRARELANRTGCTLQKADVRDEHAVRQLFESHSFGAVMHAAGTNSDALLLRTSDQKWREQMAWTRAAWLLTRAGLQNLPAGGHLVLISSRVGERGGAGQSAYATSKGAMIGLMRAAAAERRDLKINAICPGYAPSALSDNIGEKARARREGQNLLPAADAAQSLAQMCLWLLNANVSGQVLRPDCRIQTGWTGFR